MTMPLTCDEYVQQSGAVCPNCGSSEISAGQSEADGTWVLTQVVCHTCQALWVDNYNLTGYSELEIEEA
jgi:hypothetical protein